MQTSYSGIEQQDEQLAKALNAVQILVAGDDFLKPAVLDLQVYDDTLVVLTDYELPRQFVQNIIEASWPGPVEVYCATDMMIGAATTH